MEQLREEARGGTLTYRDDRAGRSRRERDEKCKLYSNKCSFVRKKEFMGNQSSEQSEINTAYDSLRFSPGGVRMTQYKTVGSKRKVNFQCVFGTELQGNCVSFKDQIFCSCQSDLRKNLSKL